MTAPSEPTTLLYDVTDGIATITLSRPDRLNAFVDEMEAELIEAFDRIAADDTGKAVVLTGAGRGFCPGMEVVHPGDAFVAWPTPCTATEGQHDHIPGEAPPLQPDGVAR